MFRKTMFAAFAAAGLSLAMPNAASAQEQFPLVGGDYIEVGMIKVDDGHALDYANHITGPWMKGQEYAKAQGWITDYQIWHNQFAREGEADVYLVTWYSKVPTVAEEEARNKAYGELMKQSLQQMQEASGQRAEYRHLAGSMLFRQQLPRK